MRRKGWGEVRHYSDRQAFVGSLKVGVRFWGKNRRRRIHLYIGLNRSFVTRFSDGSELEGEQVFVFQELPALPCS